MQHYSNLPLAQFTTFGIGGIARNFFIPETENELTGLVLRFNRRGRKFYVLGNGSNLLISSRRIRQPVIYIKNALSEIKFGDCGRVYVGASVDIRKVINDSVKMGLRAPVELLTIPATVGGAVCMNAGRTSFGVTISQSIESVRVFNGQKTIVLNSDECHFGHRNSIFQNRIGWVILGCTFKYTKEDKPAILQDRRESLRAGYDKCYRTEKSAGSIFKTCHPKIMDRLRGMRFGDAAWSRKTPNCIVNLGNARAYEVLLLIFVGKALHFLKCKRCKVEVGIW